MESVCQFEVCCCGRTFTVPQAYTFHKRSCNKTKKRLSSALDKAKDIWQAKKRRKLEEKQSDPVPDEGFTVTPSQVVFILPGRHSNAYL
jgi:hypothetical protein